MVSRIEAVREKASGSLEVAVSGGLLFFVDAVDAKLLGVAIERVPGRARGVENGRWRDDEDGRARENEGGRASDVDAKATLTLWPEAELTEEQVGILAQLDALRHARFYAAQIAARAEQGTRQMYEKLVHKGFAAEIARAAVSWMCKVGYIDDVRYVRMLLQAHSVKRGQGLLRVQQIAWQRVGLFESQKRIMAEAVEGIEEDDMVQAVKKSAEQMLKRTKKAIQRSRQVSEQKDSFDNPYAGEIPHVREGNLRSMLRAHLTRMGFPGKAIDAYLESLGNTEK